MRFVLHLYETADPGKLPDDVKKAIDVVPNVPERIAKQTTLPERIYSIDETPFIREDGSLVGLKTKAVISRLAYVILNPDVITIEIGYLTILCWFVKLFCLTHSLFLNLLRRKEFQILPKNPTFPKKERLCLVIESFGHNYLLPVDAKLDTEHDAEYDCVCADRVLAKMEGAGSRTNIVILDACRNNPFTRSWRRGTQGAGLAFMNAPSGSLIAYSTCPCEHRRRCNAPHNDQRLSTLL